MAASNARMQATDVAARSYAHQGVLVPEDVVVLPPTGVKRSNWREDVGATSRLPQDFRRLLQAGALFRNMSSRKQGSKSFCHDKYAPCSGPLSCMAACHAQHRKRKHVNRVCGRRHSNDGWPVAAATTSVRANVNERRWERNRRTAWREDLHRSSLSNFSVMPPYSGMTTLSPTCRRSADD